MLIRKTNLLRLLTFILAFTLIPLSSFGAAVGTGAAPDANAPANLAPAAGQSCDYNVWARYLAGLGNRQSAPTTQGQASVWANYARFINRSWARFDQRHLAPMKTWASQELAAATTATVFYPFSGPDFVNMYNLFPHAKTYLMIALEPVGGLPDFSAQDEPQFFASLERSLCDLLQLNFFITKKLHNSLQEPEMQGILPVLLFFLARENTRVVNVSYWLMNPDGAIKTSATPNAKIGRGDVAGVRLDFVRAGAQEQQTLYYFQFNLRNYSLQDHQQFVSFLKSFGPLTTFAKAASYLMHKPGYSQIRQFILAQSFYILEADSAIPLKYFKRSLWNLKFYGTYTAPIDYFKNFRQPDLAEVYQRGTDVYPLPFGIDYRHRINTSNLMFAAKKVQLAAGAAP